MIWTKPFNQTTHPDYAQTTSMTIAAHATKSPQWIPVVTKYLASTMG